MVTITLPPDLEHIVTEQATKQGTTPELFLLDELRERYLPAPPISDYAPTGEETMADFFADYAGTVDSREIVPGGADLSKNTSAKFKELMFRKYRNGQS